MNNKTYIQLGFDQESGPGVLLNGTVNATFSQAS